MKMSAENKRILRVAEFIQELNEAGFDSSALSVIDVYILANGATLVLGKDGNENKYMVSVFANGDFDACLLFDTESSEQATGFFGGFAHCDSYSE